MTPINNSERFELIKQTLIMIAGTESNNSDELIEDNLSEIEGDNYSFLHRNNLLRLSKDFKLFNPLLINQIVSLRQTIEDLPNHLWNVSDYKQSKEGNYIKEEAKNLLSKIG